MKRVSKSKEPSVRHMLNMASNLKEKFNKPSLIKIDCWHYSGSGSNQNRAKYNLYIENKISIDFDFWYELQAYYFGLMK